MIIRALFFFMGIAAAELCHGVLTLWDHMRADADPQEYKCESTTQTHYGDFRDYRTQRKMRIRCE